MIVLETVWPALVGLAFLMYLGVAPTWLLLPPRLGRLRWAAVPWTGFAAFVVLAQFSTQAGLDMGATAGLALLLATAANIAWLATQRRRGMRPPAATRAGLALAGLAGLVFMLGVAPLWIYGYHTPLGENWDGEIYLALAAYLQHYAQPSLVAAPPNPLLHILLVPPYSVRTHGFSYYQAALNALTGEASLQTLGPLLALLHALAVPAGFFFYRAAWHWPAGRALVAAAVLGLNPFLLWITYNTFGMQVPGLGLLPLATGATLLAIRHAASAGRVAEAALTATASGFPAWRPGLYAALLTAGLAVTYHPALTAWAAIVGAGGIALLLQYRDRWRAILTTALGLAVGAGLLSAAAQLYGLQGFLRQYAEQTGGLGLTAFSAPTDALGLSLSFRSLLTAGPGQPVLAAAVQGYAVLIVIGGLLAGGAGLLWLRQGVRRGTPDGWLAVATVLGGLVYLLLFLRPLDYVYGWFKAQSFVAFLLVAAVVGGLVGLYGQVRRAAGPWRVAAGLVALVPAGACLLTLVLLLWQYHEPLRYSAAMADAVQVERYIQPGDTAFISNSRLMPGRLFNGLLAYFLRDSVLYGTFHTANSDWDHSRPDGAYTWSVAPAREPPGLYGYQAADRAWGNALVALYHAPATLQYHRTWDSRGDYPLLTSMQGTAWAALAPGDPVSPGARTLELAVAALTTATLQLQVSAAPGGAAGPGLAVPLQPGLQQVRFTVPAGAGVQVGLPAGSPPLAVRWITARTAGGPAGPPNVVAVPDVLLLQLAGATRGSSADLRISRVDRRPPARQADRVVIDIYRSGGSGEPDHFGYWSFALSGDDAALHLPLAGGGATAGPGAAPLPAQSRRGPATNGRFTAALAFYRGDSPLDTVTDIFSFTAQPAAGGTLQITGLAVRTFPLLFY